MTSEARPDPLVKAVVSAWPLRWVAGAPTEEYAWSESSLAIIGSLGDSWAAEG